MNARSAPSVTRLLLAVGALTGLMVGCEAAGRPDLRQEIIRLEEQLSTQDRQLVAQRATIDDLEERLANCRGISEEDLHRVFYPERLVIDPLTGGDDYDGQPGDDGVTVYLKPIDRYGDVIKVAGELRIQLYDLAAPADRNLLGQYTIPVDEIGELWHGTLMTDHFTIKCPWAGAPPQNPEVTVRVVFVDYLTKRVVSAQRECTVKLPPR